MSAPLESPTCALRSRSVWPTSQSRRRTCRHTKYRCLRLTTRPAPPRPAPPVPSSLLFPLSSIANGRQAKTVATADVLKEILPVTDNFYRARDALKFDTDGEAAIGAVYEKIAEVGGTRERGRDRAIGGANGEGERLCVKEKSMNSER